MSNVNDVSNEEVRAIVRHHQARRHKSLLPVDVCDFCTTVEGDGDRKDGQFVKWPCATIRLLRAYVADRGSSR